MSFTVKSLVPENYGNEEVSVTNYAEGIALNECKKLSEIKKRDGKEKATIFFDTLKEWGSDTDFIERVKKELSQKEVKKTTC